MGRFFPSLGITLLCLTIPVAFGIYVNFKWPKQSKIILKVRTQVTVILMLKAPEDLSQGPEPHSMQFPMSALKLGVCVSGSVPITEPCCDTLRGPWKTRDLSDREAKARGA